MAAPSLYPQLPFMIAFPMFWGSIIGLVGIAIFAIYKAINPSDNKHRESLESLRIEGYNTIDLLFDLSEHDREIKYEVWVKDVADKLNQNRKTKKYASKFENLGPSPSEIYPTVKERFKRKHNFLQDVINKL